MDPDVRAVIDAALEGLGGPTPERAEESPVPATPWSVDRADVAYLMSMRRDIADLELIGCLGYPPHCAHPKDAKTAVFRVRDHGRGGLLAILKTFRDGPSFLTEWTAHGILRLMSRTRAPVERPCETAVSCASGFLFTSVSLPARMPSAAASLATIPRVIFSGLLFDVPNDVQSIVPLAEVLALGELDAGVHALDRAAIGRQLIAAVATMHRFGIIHNDLKPQNMVLVYSRAPDGAAANEPPPPPVLRLIDLDAVQFNPVLTDSFLMAPAVAAGATIGRTLIQFVGDFRTDPGSYFAYLQGMKTHGGMSTIATQIWHADGALAHHRMREGLSATILANQASTAYWTGIRGDLFAIAIILIAVLGEVSPRPEYGLTDVFRLIEDVAKTIGGRKKLQLLPLADTATLFLRHFEGIVGERVGGVPTRRAAASRRWLLIVSYLLEGVVAPNAPQIIPNRLSVVERQAAALQ